MSAPDKKTNGRLFLVHVAGLCMVLMTVLACLSLWSGRAEDGVNSGTMSLITFLTTTLGIVIGFYFQKRRPEEEK